MVSVGLIWILGLCSGLVSLANSSLVALAKLLLIQTLTLILRWVAGLVSCGVLLFIAVLHIRYLSDSSIWSLGFGTVNVHTILDYVGTTNADVGHAPTSNALIPTVLLANTPQLLLSALYFLYNSIFTRMLAASEWSRFALQRKSLRVSSPQGEQRSTYWLQLPWTYSIPLGIAAVLLHWLASQSLFLVKIDTYNPRQILDPSKSFSSCGYSAYALAMALIVGSIMVIALLANGFRQIDPTMMRVARSCSLAISAACHRPPEDTEASLLPVQWGAVFHDSEKGPGHCCFTSLSVDKPIEGHRYM